MLRDRTIPAAFPHPHAATHRTKLSSPGPGAREPWCLLGVPPQGAEMRHLLGFLFGQMLLGSFSGGVGKGQNQTASPGLPCSLHPSRAKAPSQPGNSPRTMQ